MPTHIFIKGDAKRLPKNSLILLEQIRVIDKERLRYYIGTLNSKEMQEVDKGIIISLGIDIDKATKDESYFERIALEKEEKTEFITRKQVASYGIVARENLKSSGNLKITSKLFGNYILTLMELHSPVEIEKLADEIINNEM